MEPFSITVGALGITQAAITSIVTLHNQIDSIARAETVFKDVSSELHIMQHSLSALEGIDLHGQEAYSLVKQDLEKTGVAEAVNVCGKAAAAFSKKVEQWTKHSTASRLSLRDHLSIGIWNKEKLGRFQSQVHSCRANVQFAVQSTQLLVQLHTVEQSAADRNNVKQQLQDLEKSIREHIDATNREQRDVQKRKLEVEQDDGEDEAQQELAIQELDERVRLLEAGQVCAGVVFSQVHMGFTGQDISQVLTTEGSKAVVGLPANVVGKINQRIHNVQTTGKSAAVVGVYDGSVNSSMQDIFKH